VFESVNECESDSQRCGEKSRAEHEDCRVIFEMFQHERFLLYQRNFVCSVNFVETVKAKQSDDKRHGRKSRVQDEDCRIVFEMFQHERVPPLQKFFQFAATTLRLLKCHVAKIVPLLLKRLAATTSEKFQRFVVLTGCNLGCFVAVQAASLETSRSIAPRNFFVHKQSLSFHDENFIVSSEIFRVLKEISDCRS